MLLSGWASMNARQALSSIPSVTWISPVTARPLAAEETERIFPDHDRIDVTGYCERAPRAARPATDAQEWGSTGLQLSEEREFVLGREAVPPQERGVPLGGLRDLD